ncbi:MAG TPA: MBL fold metallo-hydrolase [Tepidisphaeraceae bacterium]|nr:MBL fold metallo-hydrolase [Tepidisphaeraceae bacterium]
MEVAPSIHRIAASLGGRPLFQHVILADTITVVDLGIFDTPDTCIAPFLDEFKISHQSENIRCLITHCDSDHFGGCASFRRLYPGAQILCHEFDAPLVQNKERCLCERYDFATPWGWPLPQEMRMRASRNMGDPAIVDVALSSNQRFRTQEPPIGELQIIHVPGHSRGHVAVCIPNQRIAIITDAALWKGIPGPDGKLILPPTYRFLPEYLQTIDTLEKMKLDLMLTSHYELLRGSAIKDFLAESRAFVLRLESAICSVLRRTSFLSLEEICGDLRSAFCDWPEAAHYFLAWPVTASLDHWLSIGKLEMKIDDHRRLVRLRK